jgi:uncharacterized repeat protein (TIGR03803 family)
VYDRAGNLYGETSYGGAAGFGVVFELSPPTGGFDALMPSGGLMFG